MPTSDHREAGALPPPPPPRPVRNALVVALVLSVLVHAVWTLWPAEAPVDADSTVLTATLETVPPPPVPPVAPDPPRAAAPPAPSRALSRAPWRRSATLAAPGIEVPAAIGASNAGRRPPSDVGPRAAPPEASAHAVVATPAPAPAEPAAPALPPRVDLAYKVFLGTQGFLIGDATYRFEHDGDRYRIATVGQARGLAALLMRGTGKLESRGRITADGLRPYEFAVERGSADRREVAFFDWDGGSVILNDGATAPLESPTYDPLTILWQPYFSPPGKGVQTFGLVTTRKVTRYTLTLQAEETIAWRRGDVLTERWHQRSDDGATEGWFWLAPSLHYLPIKMRVTRTARGTLEVLLDSIRADAGEAFGLPGGVADADESVAEETPATDGADAITYGMPGSGLPAMRAEDLRGQ